MTDIDSADLRPEPGDSDRGEDPTISEGPDPADGFALTAMPDGLAESARVKVLRVLTADTAAKDLKTYYDIRGDYAGRTFLDAPPVIANEFTPADLFGVSPLQMLSSIHPRAARVFLDPGPEHARLITALTSVPLGCELAAAEKPTYSAMAQLYTLVKKTLGRTRG